ncbi:MAG: FISUMP domain-containing protein [Chitinophagaceae bacterium]|jgi:hypothetical protein
MALSVSSLSFSQSVGVMTDQSGISYKTVKIGNRIWMAENLRTTKYVNGDDIIFNSNSGRSTNDAIYVTLKNGQYLYSVAAAKDKRGIAPAGWRLPTVDECEELINLCKDVKDLRSTKGWDIFKFPGYYSTVTCSNCKGWNVEYRRKVACHICKDTRSVKGAYIPPQVKDLNGNDKFKFNLKDLGFYYIDEYQWGAAFWTSGVKKLNSVDKSRDYFRDCIFFANTLFVGCEESGESYLLPIRLVKDPNVSSTIQTTNNANLSQSKIVQAPTQPKIVQAPSIVNASLPPNLKSGLSAFYDFNMNSNDESGYGNHSSLLGPTYATDRFGNAKQALRFDGISNWLTIPNSYPINSPNVSIGIWFKLENPSDYNKNYCLLQKMASNGQPINLSYSMFILNTNTLVGAYGTGSCDQISGDQFMGLPNSIKNNQWNLFVETISSSGEVRIYINGQLNNKFQGNKYVPCSSDDTHIRIGKGWNGDPAWFKGLMDDIGIWSRVLNEEEILQLYNHKK